MISFLLMGSRMIPYWRAGFPRTPRHGKSWLTPVDLAFILLHWVDCSDGASMRNRYRHLLPVLNHLGALFWIFGLLILVPLIVLAARAEGWPPEVSVLTYILPGGLSLAVAVILKRRAGFRSLDARGAMLLCALGWIGISAVGALPFCLGLKVSFLDAYFESVSGFTTTGITMLSGLDQMPRSVLFWRSFIQWLGGLGILTFFLTVVFTGGSAHRLFSAESHKIFSKRPAPGLFSTLRILWSIYLLFTVLTAGALVLEGMSVYDAVSHAFTGLSTGGYSPHDASIGHYGEQGYAHFVAIEYTIIVAMLLGGINFFVHFRVLTGGVRALWDNMEMKLFWGILAGAALLVTLQSGGGAVADRIRCSLFQVVAIMTTTGFATEDIGSPLFPALSKQVFLILMVIGGCVGSTAGGVKVLRIGVLLKMLGRQLNRACRGRAAVSLVTVDKETVEIEELRRVAALFFAWIVLLALGGAVTAAMSDLGPMEAASGMFSALGNIGPCYIPAATMSSLHPLVKITYILGMLAGRLEVLPILLLFSWKAWR